ncbi:PTS system, mannose-specific IIA component [Lactiplantibacillus pentosus KCA1]|nr:PTS sugar transporter subunit IIA [Lactiplantibacillus pentosus]EIW12497.1 PTS system, mannose-specific IIA component [Lactiplantibacillus pentosus KCA1]
MSKKIFLISHNDFAKGLKRSVEMIAGKQPNLMALGLQPGGNPDEIVQEIRNNFTDEDEVIILGDLAGGSVCNAALKLTLKPNVTLVAGTNLALVLQVVLDSESKDLETQIEKARQQMKPLALQLTTEDDESIF